MNFIKKHKKFVIIASVVFVILLTIIILIFTLFSLKSVTLNFKTGTSVLSDESIQQEIIEEVNNSRVSTVIFADKNRISDRLERKFPYLKVLSIETVFPSSFIVHCVEREELYAIESNEKVYYLDEEMKILKIIEGSFIKTSSNAVLLNIADLNLNITNAVEGQFLTVGDSDGSGIGDILANRSQNVLTSLLTAFESNNRDISIIRASYQSFKLKLKYQEAGESRIWYVCLLIEDNLGFETEIIEANDRLAEKLEVMIKVVGELAADNPERLLTGRLTVFESVSEQIMYLISNK